MNLLKYFIHFALKMNILANIQHIYITIQI